MNNCDEFIFYDDLVRASSATGPARKRPARKKPEKADTAEKPGTAAAPARKPAVSNEAGKALDRRDEGIELVLETAEALLAERSEQVWGSMVKQTLKRRRPDFNESFFGFRSFSDLLEEAEERGLMDMAMDERSGGYVIRAVKRDG
jgi:hypothetical protein